MPEDTSSTKAPETTSWTAPIAAAGDNILESVDGGLGTVFGWVGGIFLSRPYLGATLTGGLALGAAMVIGVAEVIFTLGMGYVGYRVLAYRESVVEALAKSIELRHGKLPEGEEQEP